MTSALVGYSGFVGGTLLRQVGFDALYRSTTIGEIAGRAFDLVVCAGAPAQKWLANRDPGDDRARIEGLIACLDQVRCDQFVLISTVDVFGDPWDVDETSVVEEAGLHPYGLHRRRLETFVADRFRRFLIVRLPGLVGPGLRKNVLYDLHHDNNLAAIDSRAVFQFYPMVNLLWDLTAARRAGMPLLHLTAEPVSVADLAREGFGREFHREMAARPARYDMRSIHAGLLGRRGGYHYDRRETLQAVRSYAQSEPRRPTAP